MTHDAQILKVKRISDEKEFEVGDQAWVDGLYQGTIEAFNQFQDGVRVLVDDGSDYIDDDNHGTSYYSIMELEEIPK